METKQIITQIAGSASALLLARWAWTEFRSDWRDHRRLALVTGPFLGGRTLLWALVVIVALVPLVVSMMKLELVPRSHGAAIVGMLLWLSLGSVSATIVALTRAARSAARGWLTIVGQDTVRVDADGSSVTLRLRPASARLRLIGPSAGQSYVQLDLDDGNSRVHVWGMIGLRDLKLLGGDLTDHREGLMAASSLGALCRWLAPYLLPRNGGARPRG